MVEELFSAARAEFRQLEYFYFHNCLYEGVWKDNRRRHAEVIPTFDVLHKYGHDYKVIFVGDASMSPYEIAHAGRLGRALEPGSQARSGWRACCAQWPNAVWLNPEQQKHWGYTHSIGDDPRDFSDRMYPLTLAGLEAATKESVARALSIAIRRSPADDGGQT